MTGLQHTETSVNVSSTNEQGIDTVKLGESSTSASREVNTSTKEDPDMVEIDIEDPSSSSSSSSSSSLAATRLDTLEEGKSGAEGNIQEGEDDIIMNESKMEIEEGDIEDEGGGSGSGELSDQDRNGDLDDMDVGLNQDGKRVKVYELQDTSWHDRGTGFCKGIYDDAQDIALIIVEKEDFPTDGGKAESPGGFLKEELLLSARVEKEDIYGKQQDTLIVWTEPATGLDMALSFQDPEGCEDIWQFICEVQRHLLSMTSEAETQQIPSSSSPITNSPMIGPGALAMQMSDSRTPWQTPTLANIREQEMFIRMQAKSPLGRERAMEHILNEDYIKHLIAVLEQAEDLESLEDLHALCSLMQTIILFNDNGVFEYILQDDVFMGVMGMLEYDPEFPGLKASYRQYFQDTARFRQVVEIKDENIRNKIHQTYRLLYLKDVVLARVLDDPTFNILNGFVFFNQVDIINYIQQNDAFLQQLFSGFHEPPSTSEITKNEGGDPVDEKKRDVVMFLHQLMIMGKGVQLPGRLALYRNLVERGLLFVCEWSFKRIESAQLLHAGAEILTLAVEHDSNIVRLHVFKEDDQKRRTLIMEIISLLHSTKNLGLMSQMSDTLRTLLESPPENEAFVARTKEGPLSESFSTYFYENCANVLYKPLLEAPDIKSELTKNPKFKLAREHITLLQHLVELLSFCITNHSHKASYFVLSNPISKKVVNLLYVKDKPLRHAALRYVRACLKTANHFMHRYYVKNDLFLPLLELLEEESVRDNMMISACMEVLEFIRRDNLKTIINYLFDTYRERIDKLATRAFLRKYISGLRNRWEINNEPPPPIQQSTSAGAESSKAQADRATEEDYFNASDDEETSTSSTASAATTGVEIPSKRKRMFTHGGGPKKRPAGARQPNNASNTNASSSTTQSSSSGGTLGLDYDDGSDSDSSSSGQQSPRNQPQRLNNNNNNDNSSTTSQQQHDSSTSPSVVVKEIKPTEELEEDLGDVQMRMRAKRQREEEEEEGFAGLLVGAKTGPLSKITTNDEPKEKDSISENNENKSTMSIDDKDKESSTTNTSMAIKQKTSSTPVKDMGKKIRLNLGFGKKLSGNSNNSSGGSSSSSGSDKK
ncbi:uncharacterized protein L201_000555 [Kwoniella dendrophila CBS 6074]|uniref:Serine/threonine-protein phosphatase 4 regulatory subunit 3-like central domain-containing protein n=1 Tax=Kwoniella dendrophila CBS 6074 TaxID=1295534 RepID=A0AAX4JLP2_9TREE